LPNEATHIAVDNAGRAPRLAQALARIRWQIFGGRLVVLGCPTAGAVVFASDAVDMIAISNGALASALAMLTGYVGARRLVVFPGVHVASLSLPAFVGSYGGVGVGLVVGGVAFASEILLASCILATLFFTYAFLVQRRVRRPRMAVILAGDAADLMQFDQVDWMPWTTPKAPPAGVDAIVADLRADMGDVWEDFLARCALAGVRVYHSKQTYEALTGRVRIEHLSENYLGALNPSSAYVRLKRAADIAAALIALVLAAPLLAAVAVAIKRDSPGPVFYRQRRMGYRGEPFVIWKLRTMRTDIDGPAYTEGEDPRITPLGRWLRRYRVDELPQIINILKGEMSWIGPRPESVELAAWYAQELGFYSYRHIVRPGITGWAQVRQGWAAAPDEVRYKLHYDFFYIKHFSPWLDFAIAAQTVRVILTGFGAR